MSDEENGSCCSSSLITRYSSLVTHHSSLITHYSSLITRYSSLITHRSLLITHRPSDLLEHVGAQDFEVLVDLRRVEIAQRRRDRGEQRIAVLRRVAEADHLARVRHGHGRQRYDRLRQDASVIAVIAAE